MEVEHITFMGNSVIRNTNTIFPETRKFFSSFQKKNVTQKIEETPFHCEIKNLNENIAIFNLLKNNDIICTNICCFANADKESALQHVKEIIPESATSLLVAPGKDHFIYTILRNPLSALSHLSLASEIELYIYDAILQGMINRQKKSNKNSSNFEVFVVGKQFPWKEYTGLGDQTIPVLNKYFFDVVVSFVSTTTEEVKAFRKGELETGLFVYENVPFIYFDFRNYTVDVSLNINKIKQPEEIDNWLNENSNVINLYLIDGITGILKAQRLISINFSEEIRDTLENQTELSAEEVDIISQKVSADYPTAQIQKKAVKKMTFKR